MTALAIALAAAVGSVWPDAGAAGQPAAGGGGPGIDGAADPAAAAAANDGPARGAGEQPIPFSHARHVGQAGIDCQFCHAYARRGPVAGVPSVERCAGCHRTILTDRPDIAQVLSYWEQETPIPWIRVHNLPDYVRFSHKAHLRRGVACATCHGDVGQMEIAVQVESLSMGWCVDCHQARGASRDCLVCHY